MIRPRYGSRETDAGGRGVAGSLTCVASFASPPASASREGAEAAICRLLPCVGAGVRNSSPPRSSASISAEAGTSMPSARVACSSGSLIASLAWVWLWLWSCGCCASASSDGGGAGSTATASGSASGFGSSAGRSEAMNAMVSAVMSMPPSVDGASGGGASRECDPDEAVPASASLASASSSATAGRRCELLAYASRQRSAWTAVIALSRIRRPRIVSSVIPCRSRIFSVRSASCTTASGARWRSVTIFPRAKSSGVGIGRGAGVDGQEQRLILYDVPRRLTTAFAPNRPRICPGPGQAFQNPAPPILRPGQAQVALLRNLLNFDDILQNMHMSPRNSKACIDLKRAL